MHRVVGGLVLPLLLGGGLILVDNFSAPGDGVLLFYRFQLPRDDLLDPVGAAHDVLQVGDLLVVVVELLGGDGLALAVVRQARGGVGVDMGGMDMEAEVKEAYEFMKRIDVLDVSTGETL